MSGTPSEQSQLYNSCVVHRGGDAGARLRRARRNPVGMQSPEATWIDRRASAEEPGAGDDPGTKTGIAANRAKDRTGSGTGRLKPILVVVGRRRRRRRGGLGGGPTRMGRRTSPSSFTTLPEAQFCGVIVPNSPFISLSGPAVK